LNLFKDDVYHHGNEIEIKFGHFTLRWSDVGQFSRILMQASVFDYIIDEKEKK